MDTTEANRLRERIQEMKTSGYMVKLRDGFLKLCPMPEPSNEDEELLSFMYGGHRWGSGIQADEALCLATYFKGCKSLLETGQAHGISTRLLGWTARKSGGSVISIDPQPFGHNEADFEALGISDYITTIKKPSPWITLPDDLSLDGVFIDGDHSFIALLADYQLFNYYLKQGGIIAFHDVPMTEVNYAIYEIMKRDQIEEVFAVNRLKVFKKTVPARETYFQRIRR